MTTVPARLLARVPGTADQPVRIEQCQGGVWLFARDPRLDEEAEIAQAVRYTQTGGASFSGWVASNITNDYTDPLPTKRQALYAMALMAEERLNAQIIVARTGQRLLDRYAPGELHSTGVDSHHE